MALIQRAIDFGRTTGRHSARTAIVATVTLMALGTALGALDSVSGTSGNAASRSAATTGDAGGAAPEGLGAIGIIDAVTGSSSLHINGLEIHFDDATPVTTNGRRSSVAHLAPGQVAAIETRSAGSRLVAQDIAIVR